MRISNEKTDGGNAGGGNAGGNAGKRGNNIYAGMHELGKEYWEDNADYLGYDPLDPDQDKELKEKQEALHTLTITTHDPFTMAICEPRGMIHLLMMCIWLIMLLVIHSRSITE